MLLEKVIRKLAKSNRFQTLYMLAKEGSVPIFSNIANYTHSQVLFLNYLSFYNSIYSDIAMDYVIEEVLDNEIYEDAYMHYRSKVKMSDLVQKLDSKKSDKKQEPKNDLNSFSWVMRKPKK